MPTSGGLRRNVPPLTLRQLLDVVGADVAACAPRTARRSAALGRHLLGHDPHQRALAVGEGGDQRGRRRATTAPASAGSVDAAGRRRRRPRAPSTSFSGRTPEQPDERAARGSRSAADRGPRPSSAPTSAISRALAITRAHSGFGLATRWRSGATASASAGTTARRRARPRAERGAEHRARRRAEQRRPRSARRGRRAWNEYRLGHSVVNVRCTIRMKAHAPSARHLSPPTSSSKRPRPSRAGLRRAQHARRRRAAGGGADGALQPLRDQGAARGGAARPRARAASSRRRRATTGSRTCARSRAPTEQLLARHAWAVAPIFSNPSPGLSSVRIGELALRDPRARRAAQRQAVAAFSGLIAINYGWASFTVARERPMPSHDVEAMLLAAARRGFPLTVATAAEWGAYGSDEDYEFVLGRFLDGLGQSDYASAASLQAVH